MVVVVDVVHVAGGWRLTTSTGPPATRGGCCARCLCVLECVRVCVLKAGVVKK
uniref:Uncharacterized protein n=1 Tax=Anopheles albimanus TaxID=7167 RepID=A0A182FWZ2_ANOAL